MEDRCVCCGEIVPEGQQVCGACWREVEQSPCKGCEDRSIECHIHCKTYKKWFTKRNKYNAALGKYKKQRDGVFAEMWRRKIK